MRVDRENQDKRFSELFQQLFCLLVNDSIDNGFHLNHNDNTHDENNDVHRGGDLTSNRNTCLEFPRFSRINPSAWI